MKSFHERYVPVQTIFCDTGQLRKHQKLLPTFRNKKVVLPLHFLVRVTDRHKLMLTVPAEISHSDAVILQAVTPSNARNSDQDDLLMIHLLLDKYGNKYQQLQNCWSLALTDYVYNRGTNVENKSIK